MQYSEAASSLDAVLGKGSESYEQLLTVITSRPGDNTHERETLRAVVEHGGLEGASEFSRAEGAGSGFNYAERLPSFLAAMAQLKARGPQLPAGSTMRPSSCDAVEEELLDAGEGPGSVLDAMLSNPGAASDTHWREAARAVVFDNFFSETEPFSDDCGNPEAAPLSQTPERLMKASAEDDECLSLPGMDDGISPSPHISREADYQLLEELRDVARGMDGVEAFSLDATFDYDANAGGTSRRV